MTTTPLDLVTIPGADALHSELRTLIAASRERLAGAVNAELTRLYWHVGDRLRREVLGGERAAYGSKVIDHLGSRLVAEFGRVFEAKNLHRMVKFAELFPDPEIVASLMRQLSWTHFLQLLPLKDAEARAFYARVSATEGWSVRELRRRIEQKTFERTAVASSQGAGITQALVHTETSGRLSPGMVFKDPYFLDFLGLN
ncbi:MAG: DUF1016 N-terminal domain-containing protein, partial [Desulfobulbaceae bacterium]|nr:DUF1016 N-terminal domain-containing protein [Desulfobulbaceae bacterium]